MAKTQGLIILFVLLSCAVFAEEKETPVTLTSTAVTLPSAVTQTTEYFEDILNLNVKQLQLYITPYFKVSFPDASINLGLKQMIGDTILEGMTEYNYIYNKIKYMLKYGLETYFPVYVTLYDNLEFEQIYNEKKYIQRTKGLGLSVATPLLFDIMRIGEEFKNESSYLANLNDSLEVDEGLASIFNTWFEIKMSGKLGGKDFDKFHFDVNFDKAIPHQYSNYNFLFLNSSITSNLRFENGNNLLFYAEAGYMLEAQNVPLWKIYNLGGYDRLIGYALNEFQDYYKVFGRIRFDGTIAKKIGWEWWWFRLDKFGAFVITDCGKAGNVHQLQEYNSYKYGIGAGFNIYFTFRNRTLVKATFAVGQAIEQGMLPVVYFIYELL